MKIDDTYEIDLKSTTTFNRFAIVDVEVTMKKPDDESENYKADSGKIYVNGEEITGGGYPEPTGTIELTENGTFNVKDYAEASVNVDIPEPPTGTLNITENGTFDVTDYASANVNVSGSSYSETLLWENPNPTVAFDSQNISEITRAIYESYDALKFVLTDLTETTLDNLNYLMLKNDTATPYNECIIYPKAFTSQGVTTYYGRQLIQQSSRLHIYDTNDSANYNSRCVPIAIYGVKF